MKIVSRLDAQQMRALSWANFLDDYRIGLSLQDRYSTVQGTVLLGETPPIETRSLYELPLEKDSWGLGYSEQAVSTPLNVFGLMHTRSKFARVGLDMMSSSSYVAPGFGSEEPAHIVFEITARTKIDLSAVRGVPIVSMILFSFSSAADPVLSANDYTKRFPFGM